MLTIAKIKAAQAALQNANPSENLEFVISDRALTLLMAAERNYYKTLLCPNKMRVYRH